MNRYDAAARVHAESIIIDGLNVSDWQTPETFVHLQKGGLTAINATIAAWENFTETMDAIARWHYVTFKTHADSITHVKTVEDIQKAKADGKCGIIFGFQNCSPIEDDLRRLHIFRELGVRIIQISYNNASLAGSGYLDSPDYGLTTFGKDLIAECNRQGMLIDCSHVGYKSTMDTIQASNKPIAFTHVGPRAMCDHGRNKTDEQLKALAAKGGVAGAVALSSFLAAGDNATLSDFLDTVDYMVKLIGVDHVGIGCDFTVGWTAEICRKAFTGRNIDMEPRYQIPWPLRYPKGIENASDFPNITRGLLERSYTESDVKKIMGQNFLRLFQETWV